MNAPRPPSLLRRLLRQRASRRALLLFGIIVLLCLFGPLFSPHDAMTADWNHIAVAPTLENAHWFGTDAFGRDLFVRALHGGRVSLLVGLAATLVSLVIGVGWGAVAGYLGGRVDAVMMRIVDILYAIPFMFLVILLMVFFGRNLLLMFVAIGAVNWLDMARIVRGQTIVLREREYVLAARTMGVTSFGIIRNHVLPNLVGIVIVCATLTIPQVILVESFLSFLGLGVQEPSASWGSLVNDGVREMEVAPWILWIPCVLLATSLYCLNFIGDGLRDALDPQDNLNKETT